MRKQTSEFTGCYEHMVKGWRQANRLQP